MKRLIKKSYNIHEIVNRLYREIPIVPIGNILQDIYQDIQSGLFDDCGNPEINWLQWKEKAIQILQDRNIINVMDVRNFISTANDDKLYSWEEVYEIIANAGGRIYSLPYGSYAGNFKLETITMDKIPRTNYLTIEDCQRDDLDEDESVILRLVDAYNGGSNIPPIILNNDYTIIDGSHRLGMYEYLGIYNIQAFVLQ